MFGRKELIRRIDRLEALLLDSLAVSVPTWDYKCSVCKNGVFCVDGAGKTVIACKKKLESDCPDFTLEYDQFQTAAKMAEITTPRELLK